MDSGALLRRILWGILMCFSVCFLTVQVYLNLDKLLSRQVTITKSVEVSKSLPFPAVTICNQNMMRKSQIMGTIAQDYLDQLDPVKYKKYGQKSEVPSFDVEKKVKKTGHQLDKMMQECSFPGIDCSYAKHFTMATALSFLHGLCYTFNPNSSTANGKDVTEGQWQGLRLYLNAEPSEYYGPYSYDATGFKVAIHEPGTYHHIDNVGYDVPPGFSTSIRIRREKPSPYPSNCGSKKLFNFESYSQPSCWVECVSKIVAEQCGCRNLGMVPTGVSATRFCNSTEASNCVISSTRNINAKCDCPPKCESIQYNVKTSIAYYPSEHGWEAMIDMHNKTGFNATGFNASDPEQLENLQADIRKSYAAVTIFYESTSTDVTEEKPSYNFSDFGSFKLHSNSCTTHELAHS
ncbi:Acid-sensing ion channel 3 [Exaiptasia diaphana]|nr:Acid-sensing ion channel 3 [Exaiptasia diaphana]